MGQGLGGRRRRSRRRCLPPLVIPAPTGFFCAALLALCGALHSTACSPLLTPCPLPLQAPPTTAWTGGPSTRAPAGWATSTRTRAPAGTWPPSQTRPPSSLAPAGGCGWSGGVVGGSCKAGGRAGQGGCAGWIPLSHGGSAHAAAPCKRVLLSNALMRLTRHNSLPNPTQPCRRCYEVRCDPRSVVTDGYGNSFDRSGVCKHPGATVVVRTVDNCEWEFPWGRS